MKKGEKRFLLILISITAVVIVISMVLKGKKSENRQQATPQQTIVAEQNDNVEEEEFVEKQADGTKLNTSSTLAQEKKLGDLVFQNIQLTNKDGMTTLLADVTNTGSTQTKLQLLDVLLFDKNGEQIGRVGGIIGELEPGANTQFNSSTTIDLANAYDFKVQEKQQ